MCSGRSITQPIGGPATDALERLAKRRRSETSDKRSRILDQNSFADIFNELAAVQEDEIFPSISWSFDEDSADGPPALNDNFEPTTAYTLGRKRSRTPQSGLLRSMSFKQDLAQLYAGSACDHIAALTLLSNLGYP